MSYFVKNFGDIKEYLSHKLQASCQKHLRFHDKLKEAD